MGAAVLEFAEKLTADLRKIGVRVMVDNSERRAPDKMWAAIKRGVPLRVEVGAREVEQGMLTHTRRDLGRKSKTTCSVAEFLSSVTGILDNIHQSMYNKVKTKSQARVQTVATFDQVKQFYTSGQLGFVRMPVEILENGEYQTFKKENGLSSRCLSFEDEGRMVLMGSLIRKLNCCCAVLTL